MKRCAEKGSGFALITVLLMVVIVAVALSAFLAAVASDRASSQAIYNATRARLAVESAVTLGIARLRDHFEEHPDSATAWETLFDAEGNPLTEATLLYYRPHPAASWSGTAPVWVHPLVSGGEARLVAEKRTALPASAGTVDLNAARYPGDEAGWLGSPPGGRKPRRVPWVEMTDPGDPQKVIGRFAFWIEDESFRLNLNAAERADAHDPAAMLRPGAILLQAVLEAANPSLSGSTAAAVKTLRAASPGGRLLELQALSQLEGFPSLGEELRFSATLFSGALNLSRSGAKRLNLNTRIHDTVYPLEIRRQLDQIITAIETQAPDFGQRFYRLNGDLNASQVTSEHARIYLQKIAANLRDYIDTDSQPTIVNADGTIRLGRPTAGIEPQEGAFWPGNDWAAFKGGPNSVIAVGKEAVPYMQEFACRVQLLKFNPPSGKDVVQSEYDFTLDYYFEFWNMTTKPIQLGGDAFLRVYNQAGFDTGSATPPIARGAALDFPIPSTLVFLPGKVTVLTTDPTPPAHWVKDVTKIVTLPVGEGIRRYLGFTRKKTSDNKFRIDLLARSTMKLNPGGGSIQPLTDYETGMVLGNDAGVIESLCTLPLARGKYSSNNALSIHNDNNATINNPDGFLYRGGSLFASLPGSQVGDPRSNNEQLFLRIYDGGGDNEQTRYYNSGLDNEIVPAESTLGTQNTNYTFPGTWPDPSPWNPSGIDAPMEIADGPMRSIGELGHLYDPARRLGPTGNITYSRGGGRTLSIGQPDPLWDREEESASRDWAAWRLADLFCTGDETALEGAINLNGVRRDGGAALKAALRGFTFSATDQPDPDLASRALSADAVAARVIAWLNGRETPFLERGQLSEALAFQAAWASGSEPRYDRGREEIFRRLVELSATRGNVFTVYAVGQAITQTRAGKKEPVATSRIKLTFRIDPEWNPALDDDFDPANPAEVAARFRKPDRYRVTRLQASP